MENKTLSEQICEVCGIEPLNSENAYFVGNLGKLPDFEKPTNFTKLFNLKINEYEHTTFAYIVSFKIGIIENSERFLKVLSGILQGNYLVNKDLVEQMKKV